MFSGEIFKNIFINRTPTVTTSETWSVTTLPGIMFTVTFSEKRNKYKLNYILYDKNKWNFLRRRVNPFHTTDLFYTPWEYQKTSDLSNVFSGHRKRPVVWNELMNIRKDFTLRNQFFIYNNNWIFVGVFWRIMNNENYLEAVTYIIIL